MEVSVNKSRKWNGKEKKKKRMIGGAGETAPVRNNDLSVRLRLKGDRGEGKEGAF